MGNWNSDVGTKRIGNSASETVLCLPNAREITDEIDWSRHNNRIGYLVGGDTLQEKEKDQPRMGHQYLLSLAYTPTSIIVWPTEALERQFNE